jgi:hypothetical protein
LTALSASFLDRPLVDATLSTNSDFVMRSSFCRAGGLEPARGRGIREANSAFGRRTGVLSDKAAKCGFIGA